MAVERIFDLGAALFDRSTRLVKLMFQLHVDVAVEEAAKEQKRLVKGIVLLLVAASCLIFTLLLIQILGVLGVHQAGLNWPASIATIAAIDVVIAALCISGASRILKGPYMQKTRLQLAKTATSLAGSEG